MAGGCRGLKIAIGKGPVPGLLATSYLSSDITIRVSDICLRYMNLQFKVLLTAWKPATLVSDIHLCTAKLQFNSTLRTSFLSRSVPEHGRPSICHEYKLQVSFKKRWMWRLSLMRGLSMSLDVNQCHIQPHFNRKKLHSDLALSNLPNRAHKSIIVYSWCSSLLIDPLDNRSPTHND